MAAVRPAGPDPTMISLLSVLPSEADTKPGPPGAVPIAGAPKSIASEGRGAGADGAATAVSAEKSMTSPPNAGRAPVPPAPTVLGLPPGPPAPPAGPSAP